jgi:hypothetical protein
VIKLVVPVTSRNLTLIMHGRERGWRWGDINLKDRDANPGREGHQDFNDKKRSCQRK